MNIHPERIPDTCGLPVDLIAETRSSFSHCTLSFEVEFEADGLVALSSLVLLIERSGLACDNLRFCGSNRIFTRLSDRACADLRKLDAELASQSSIRLVRWTSVLSRRSR